MSGLGPPPSGGRWSFLAPYFPLPLVGAAALLAVLILLTPNLLSTGSPSAGSLESQAELLVDRASSQSNVTHLYLRGIGLARYTSLEIDWAQLPDTAAPSNLSGVTWTERAEGNESLELATSTPAPVFAVNATAVYVDASGAGVSYAASFAFQWVGGTLVTTAYGSATGASPTPVSQLPLVLLLVQGPYAGGP